MQHFHTFLIAESFASLIKLTNKSACEVGIPLHQQSNFSPLNQQNNLRATLA